MDIGKSKTILFSRRGGPNLVVRAIDFKFKTISINKFRFSSGQTNQKSDYLRKVRISPKYGH